MINDRSYRDFPPQAADVCVVRLAGPGALHDGLRPVPLAGGLARPLQGRLDTPLTRVCASGATNECRTVGVPTPPLFLPNSDGT